MVMFTLNPSPLARIIFGIDIAPKVQTKALCFSLDINPSILYFIYLTAASNKYRHLFFSFIMQAHSLYIQSYISSVTSIIARAH